MIYYTIHQITGDDYNEDGTVNYGSRNCRVFLFGSVIYVLLYTFIQMFVPAAQTTNLIMSLILLWMVDAITMAYLYKQYFGRIITDEFNDKEETYIYDKNNHKYTYSPDLEIQNKIKKNVVKNMIKSAENTIIKNSKYVEEAGDDIYKQFLLINGISVPNPERYRPKIKHMYRGYLYDTTVNKLPDDIINNILDYLV